MVSFSGLYVTSSSIFRGSFTFPYRRGIEQNEPLPYVHMNAFGSPVLSILHTNAQSAFTHTLLMCAPKINLLLTVTPKYLTVSLGSIHVFISKMMSLVLFLS